MPRKKSGPSYLLHKATGQARTIVDGQTVYLGPHNSPESLDRFDAIRKQWILGQSAEAASITVGELCLRYMEHVKLYYRKDGKPTSECENIRVAIKYLIARKKNTRAVSFGPRALREVRDAMIEAGCVRTSVNRMVGRVKRVFRWAVAEEILPAEVVVAIDSIDGLKAGRSKAAESQPVEPVSLERVKAIKPFVSRQVWAMVKLQLFTAARPGEIRMMRTCDIRDLGDVWEYVPHSHKTEHLGRTRVIYLGAKAQRVVAKFLKPHDPDSFLFSPADAKAEFYERLSEGRKIPATSSQKKRVRKSKPAKKPGECYTDCSYSAAIRKACEKAFGMPEHLRNVGKNVPPEQAAKWKAEARAWRQKNCWHPHQLRHTKATAVRKQFGIEASSALLGHAGLKTSEIYTHRAQVRAKKIAREVG